MLTSALPSCERPNCQGCTESSPCLGAPTVRLIPSHPSYGRPNCRCYTESSLVWVPQLSWLYRVVRRMSAPTVRVIPSRPSHGRPNCQAYTESALALVRQLSWLFRVIPRMNAPTVKLVLSHPSHGRLNCQGYTEASLIWARQLSGIHRVIPRMSAGVRGPVWRRCRGARSCGVPVDNKGAAATHLDAALCAHADVPKCPGCVWSAKRLVAGLLLRHCHSQTARAALCKHTRSRHECARLNRIGKLLPQVAS